MFGLSIFLEASDPNLTESQITGNRLCLILERRNLGTSLCGQKVRSPRLSPRLTGGRDHSYVFSVMYTIPNIGER